MNTTRVLLMMVLVGGAAVTLHEARAQQQQPGITRTDLQRHDLSIRGREVIQARVELAPGVSSARHWHPGEEIVYVLEGELIYEVEGMPPVTLKAGDVLFIPARTIHLARNVGNVPGAELATYVIEKGKPPFVAVP